MMTIGAGKHGSIIGRGRGIERGRIIIYIRPLSLPISLPSVRLNSESNLHIQEIPDKTSNNGRGSSCPDILKCEEVNESVSDKENNYK